MNKNLYVVIVCFYSNLVFGQFTNLKFENLNTENGLSSSSVLEIFQDKEGYLWFGTIDGLDKYNGYGFDVFRPILNDSTSISNNRINAIEEDKDGNLWIGTDNGLNLFNKKTKRFIRIKLHKDSIKEINHGKIVSSLLYDEHKNELWIGRESGLIKIILNESHIDENRVELVHYISETNDENSLDNNDISSIVQDKNGIVWVETSGEYLNKYNAESNTFDRVLIKSTNHYELNHIPKRLLIDADNDFWIGNDMSNIVFWDRLTNTFKNLLLTDKSIPIYNFYQDSSGIIWMLTDGQGIYLYDKTNEKLQHLKRSNSDPFSLPSNQVSKVMEDKDGVFWIATYNEGVSKLDLKKSNFGHYYYQEGKEDGLNEKIVQSVLQDSKQRIWISAYRGGLNLFDEDTNTFQSFCHKSKGLKTLSSNKIMYTFEDSQGYIWVCTYDGGVNRFNPETHNAKRFLHSELNENSVGQNSVYSGVEDKKQRIWFGLKDEGIDVYDIKSQMFHHFKIGEGRESGLLSDFVPSLFIDSKNRLLVGTGLGLNYVSLGSMGQQIPDKLHFVDVAINGITGNRINYITEDHLYQIWIGTDNGLFKLDSNLNLIESYFVKEGLPNNFITGIKEDLNHNFWITSKSGLSFLNPKTNQFKNFNTHNGIQGVEYQSRSIERTKDGRIIVGGINGFNIFQPSAISITSSDKLFPEISDLKINYKSIKVGDVINEKFVLTEPISEAENVILSYKQANLTFGFIALHFENQEQVKYAYKMEGLDEEYINIGSNRVVNYSNIRPGEYTFKVKASVDGDWDNAPVSSIDIVLNSPPWETWIAYTIYTILLILLLQYLNKYFTNRIKQEKEREFDQMKFEFFINVSHEFRTPLTLILNPLDKLISGINDPELVKTSAQSIQRSARRLLYLVNQLLDYRKMEVGMAPLRVQKGDVVKFSNDIFSLFKGLVAKKNIEYTFTATSDQLLYFFDFDKIEKILTNLISNAIKFTDNGGEINVSVNKIGDEKNSGDTASNNRKLSNYIEIIVADTGIGLDKEQLKKVFSRFYNVDVNKTGTGIGLNFTKGLVELHGGEIFVESEYGKGSKFVVRIPLNKKEESGVVEAVKDEFLINSMKSVEYDMLISEGNQPVADKESTNDKKDLAKVLIVEDNKELREHLKTELGDEYEIFEAVNGEEGLKKVLKYYPDIVVSDVMMPKMDGFELCKQIKSEFDTCHIPVVLLTARALEEDRIEGYKIGADGYLGKPFNLNVLKARIANLLEAKRIVREKFSKLGAVIKANEVTSNSIDEAFLEKNTKIILDNISDTDFKLEHLLKEVGIGRSQFYRKIQSITGQNPSNFIRTIRLKYASDLLLQEVHTIKEVTHLAGFNSAAYFGKTFKELYNMTPSEYVENNKKESLEDDE